MKQIIGILVFSLLVWNGFAQGGTGNLMLTVAYSPDEFSGKLAVVQLDPQSGKFSIVSQVDLPDSFENPILLDPTVGLDSATNNLYLYFIEETTVLVVNLNSGQITSNFAPSDDFFTGFENFQFNSNSQLLQGFSATVTQNGYCNDGCFQYGTLDLGGNYNSIQNIPFKALLDDSHYLDTSKGQYWVQGSYDLRDPSQRCAPVDSDECLLQIDSTSGNLLSAQWTNWTVYKYSNQFDTKGNQIVWMEGFDNVCNHPYNNFLFASVNLPTAQAQPIACIGQNVTVHMDEWISSFSLDGKLFATGSGDSEAPAQLLIFEVETGALYLNSPLKNLAQALNAADNMFDVWSVDWVSS